MTKQPQEQLTRVHCNACGHPTNHLILASRNQRSSDPEDLVWDEARFDLLECAGCEEIVVRRDYFFSEWNRGEKEITFYPPPISRRMPGWCFQLAPEFKDLLDEIYAALHAGSKRLVAMGARALLDIALQAEVGDIGGFEEKLKQIEDQGVISSLNRNTLEAALDAGSAAAHRGHSPTDEDIQTMMDIIENLLQSLLLPNAASKLSQATPKRGR